MKVEPELEKKLESLFQKYGYFDASRRFTTYEFLLRYLSNNDADYIENFIVANMSNIGESSDPRLRISFLTSLTKSSLRIFF